MKYFAVYNAHLFAQMFEGKIQVRIMLGHDKGYHTPVCNAHKAAGVHYAQACITHGKVRYAGIENAHICTHIICYLNNTEQHRPQHQPSAFTPSFPSVCPELAMLTPEPNQGHVEMPVDTRQVRNE